MNPLSRQEILAILNNPKLDLGQFQFSDEMIAQFQEFCTLLQKWNEKINLTSEKNALEILEKHVFDSLQYLRWLDSSCKTLDIGSGGGFPGIPVKILNPDLDLTLLESQRKRCNFLREVIRSLKLENIDVAEGRADYFSCQEPFSENYDRVLFRGFSSYETCLGTGLPFLKIGGLILLQKSPDELPDSARLPFENIRIIESKEVLGYKGQISMMMVIEKCST